MPELKLGDDGQVLDPDGKPFLVEGEPVTIAGAKRQEDIDKAFQAEKAKHKEKLDTLNGRIKTLESQAEKSGETQRLLDELREEKSGMESRLQNAEREAEGKVATQLQRASEEAKTFKEQLEQERSARVQDQVKNAILSNTKDRFNNPNMDVVPHLLGAHVREPVKGADGKDSGQFLDTFKMTFENEKGEKVTENLDVEKALDVWATKYPHHVKASSSGGSGGASFVNAGNAKRSEMTAAQKADFVGKHGVEAFQGLPQ